MRIHRFFSPVALCSGLLLFLSGCGSGSFLITPVSGTSHLEQVTVQPGTGPGKIAILEVEGMLLDERTSNLLQQGENPLSLFTQQLDECARDDSVKAVVLRVNSPGGSVTTSDIMYNALIQFRKETHKPVIASAQEVMASGSYYVSCASDKIVVNPTSIVGSIGVIFDSFDFEDTLTKLGIRSEAIKSAPLKDMGSPYKHLTPEAREVMQGMVDEYYARFKNLVASNRGITDTNSMDLVSDGRVFSGTRAVELKLADQTGGLPDAINLARQMSGATGAKAVMYKREYAYSGSIYAEMPGPLPKANTNQMTLKLPLSESLPAGFYYLWEPDVR
jgi:protease-4